MDIMVHLNLSSMTIEVDLCNWPIDITALKNNTKNFLVFCNFSYNVLMSIFLRRVAQHS